jgi:hypothetical protein
MVLSMTNHNGMLAGVRARSKRDATESGGGRGEV